MGLIFVPEGEDLDGLTRSEVLDLSVDETTMELDFEGTLDEVYGPVSICGYEYEASYALREVDPIAYRCGYADYVSSYYVEVDPDDFPEASPEVEAREDGDPLAD